jgi:tetratricopeptide (TPR) repeat protein
LYLTALHLEQYRHATWEPEDYYLEGLRRDGGDSRINTAYGFLLLRRGYTGECEEYFRRAIERITWKNPNPRDGEAYCGLGLSLFLRKDYDKAFDVFYKASWSDAQQSLAFRYLALISARRGAYREALGFAEQSLVKNSHDSNTRALKAVLLRKLGLPPAGWLRENIALDPFDFLSRFEYDRLNGTNSETLNLMRDNPDSFITAALEYASAGFYHEAVEVLWLCGDASPMLKYYEAEYLFAGGATAAWETALREAAARSAEYCFPNRIEDISPLEFACAKNPLDSHAPYLLGSLYYDKKQYDKAVSYWERSIKIDSGFPTAHRNAALAYFNKKGDPGRARRELETAFELDKTDARVFMELDQLYKRLGFSPGERLKIFEEHGNLFRERDDTCVEYVTLLNLQFRHEEALEFAASRNFHPWEGGEGKITAQYAKAKIELAKQRLKTGGGKTAVRLLEEALVFPGNLGEGKLAGALDNDIYYWLGRAHAGNGDKAKAGEAYEKAAIRGGEPAGVMFYNDQPADLILYEGLACRALGREKEALSRFNKLADYGEKHFFDTARIDYFAVSLPDLQLFEDDLDKRSRIYCRYLIALGSLGLGRLDRAASLFEECLKDDPCNLDVLLHWKTLKEGLLCL